MVFMLCKECGHTLLVAVGIEEWHCLNALCKSNASGMNSSLQRILKNASGMKEPFLPPLETELEDILDEGDGPNDDDYLEACAQVEGGSVKGTVKPDVCKSAVPKRSRNPKRAQVRGMPRKHSENGNRQKRGHQRNVGSLPVPDPKVVRGVRPGSAGTLDGCRGSA